MSEDAENLLEPKTHRSKAEIGREIMDALRSYDEIRVTMGDSPFDVKIYPHEE